ncbi:hypothetical protein EV182_008935, partial [Spiromyces aspiralis]
AVKRAKDALNMESTNFEALDGAFSQHQTAYTMVNETYAGHNFEGDYSHDLEYPGSAGWERQNPLQYALAAPKYSDIDLISESANYYSQADA